MQTASMIRVQMGQDHDAHIFGANAELEQLWANLLFGGHVEPDRQPEVRMPAGKPTWLTRSGGLTRIHHNNTFGSLDRPGKDGECLGP